MKCTNSLYQILSGIWSRGNKLQRSKIRDILCHEDILKRLITSGKKVEIYFRICRKFLKTSQDHVLASSLVDVFSRGLLQMTNHANHSAYVSLRNHLTIEGYYLESQRLWQ